MDKHLQEHSCVSPSLALSRRSKFLIAGDQGPFYLPMVCCEGAAQAHWKGLSWMACRRAERIWKVILAKQQEQRVIQAECCRLWLLNAHSLQCPISSFWMENCSHGIPEVDLSEWNASYMAHHNSEQRQKTERLQVQKLAAVQAEEGGQIVPQSHVCEASLGGAVLRFGLPHEPCGEEGELRCPDRFHCEMPAALPSMLQVFGVPNIFDDTGLPSMNRTQPAEVLDRLGLPMSKPQASRRDHSPKNQVRYGDAMTPFLYSALASLQSCFAYLQGMRVGEASHPGPKQGGDSSACQIKHDPHTGRIGEATNPGPSPFGPELENMIKQYVMEAVREAIKEAFQNLGLRAPASSAQSAGTAQGHQVSEMHASKPDKGSSTGKGKPQKQPPNEKDRGKGKEATSAKPLTSTKPDLPPDPPTAKRGKGRGQVADNEWKLVTRQHKAGEFQLRSQDWNAAVIPFGKLSAAIDATDADAVLEGVVSAEKQEVEHAKIMLQGSKVRYKFLLICLAKEETSQKIPGRIQDQLCFKDAMVLQCHSSAVGNTPTPAGLASAPIKVAPLQSVAVYVRVPKQYVSEQIWTSFCKNASKTAATWAADRHVQPLDSFNWAEEKHRTGGQELQVFGIMRIPQKDMSTLLAVSGQQGVFIEPCRSQAPQIKISWVEKVKGETTAQYLTRANQHGAAFGLAVHGGRLGWRLAAQPDELRPRVWTLPWLPVHWDDDAVKQLLASEFKDIVLLTHRRSRGNLSYRFRATCLQGDKDLVALLAETDTGPLTLWASVAPARTIQKSQRKLPQGAVPVIAPKERSTAFPTTSKAVSEPEVGTDGKPVPGAKRTKCDVRTVPKELKTIEIAKDGNCIYRAVSEGLTRLSGGKIKVEHREMRAKAITHLQKHRAAYSAHGTERVPQVTLCNPLTIIWRPAPRTLLMGPL